MLGQRGLRGWLLLPRLGPDLRCHDCESGFMQLREHLLQDRQRSARAVRFRLLPRLDKQRQRERSVRERRDLQLRPGLHIVHGLVRLHQFGYAVMPKHEVFPRLLIRRMGSHRLLCFQLLRRLRLVNNRPLHLIQLHLFKRRLPAHGPERGVGLGLHRLNDIRRLDIVRLLFIKDIQHLRQQQQRGCDLLCLRKRKRDRSCPQPQPVHGADVHFRLADLLGRNMRRVRAGGRAGMLLIRHHL